MRDEELIIEVTNLKTYFNLQKGLFKTLEVKAVDGVSFQLKRGGTLAIVGESGSGKTTLGRTILRLVNPTSGKIIFEGRDITTLSENELKWFRKKAQMVFQDPYASLNPYMSIKEIVEEPLIIHKIGNEKEREEKVIKALIDVKLQPPEEFLHKYPHELSGGQRQRVSIARAMILNPSLIVADEPVSMIDASSRAEILFLFKNLQKMYNLSFIYITHDIATAKYFSEDIAVMYLGKFVEKGKIKEVVDNPLHPYTQALIQAVPDPDPNNRFVHRKVVSGEIPNPINPPSGCRFHPRCPYAMDICKKEEPKFVSISNDHSVACHLFKESK